MYRRWMDGRRDDWINESSNSISDSRQATVIKGPVRKWMIIRHENVLKTNTFGFNSVETRCVFISFDKRLKAVVLSLVLPAFIREFFFLQLVPQQIHLPEVIQTAAQRKLKGNNAKERTDG